MAHPQSPRPNRTPPSRCRGAALQPQAMICVWALKLQWAVLLDRVPSAEERGLGGGKWGT